MTGEPGVRSAAKVSALTLAGLVVGSMVGAGVFSLPGRFAAETGVIGALIAWGIAGGGMLTLALVFQRLALRRPDLDAGVYAYARAGFGRYAGFFSAFGYWASACAGNVFYWVFIMSTLGGVFPALGAGDTLLAVTVSSAGLWLFYALVRSGAREAAAVNRIVSVAKVLPIVVFVLLCVFALDPDVFVQNLSGGADAPVLYEQVRGTLLVTVFAFIGVEGASAYSRHARRRSDIGRATVLGFLAVLAVFMSVTIVSYGILPRERISELRQPSMAGVLEAVVGGWGAAFIGAALVVAVLGAYLSWTLMAAEVLLVAARSGDLPQVFARTNAKDVPVGALTLSTLLVQVLLLVVLFAANAFNVALNLTSALALIPYFLTAGFALKLALTDRSDSPRQRVLPATVAVITTAYTGFLLYAAGAEYTLLSLLIIAPATALFAAARRSRGERVFTPAEWMLFALAAAGAITAAALIATGVLVI